MMLLVIKKCEIFKNIEKMKLCWFSVFFGKFANMTYIYCGSDGANNISPRLMILKIFYIIYFTGKKD